MTGTELISVPALIEGGEVVVPAVELGRDLRYHFHRREGVAYSDDLHPRPTLAELRHAFFGKNPDGSFISPDYRESVFSIPNISELTSTFLRDDGVLIERPEIVQYDEKHDLWIAEGGKSTPVEWVSMGFPLGFVSSTGFPTGTTMSARKIIKEIGPEFPQSFIALRPWKGVKYPGGLRPMRRGLVEMRRYHHRSHDSSHNIPFCIAAMDEPGSHGFRDGYHAVYRRGDYGGL